MKSLHRHLLRTAARAAAALASAAATVAAPAPGHPMQKCSVDGATVYQSAPCLREAAAAAPTPAAATSRGPSPESLRKRKTLAETLREHDAADRPPAPAPIGNGFNVLQDRMGAR